MPPRRTIDIQDGPTLRALAHPLRARLLAALRVDGPATASGLATRFEESSGLTSYHLRVLERAGFVHDDVDRGSRRERWWAAAQESTRWQLGDFLDDAGDREAADWLLKRQLQTQHRWVSDWARGAADWPREWVDAADVSDFLLHLTPEDARALKAELHAVVERHLESLPADRRPSSEPGPESVERVALLVNLLPMRELPL